MGRHQQRLEGAWLRRCLLRRDAGDTDAKPDTESNPEANPESNTESDGGANADARGGGPHLRRPDRPQVGRFDSVPSTLSADPQVATVGPTERQLAAEGRSYLVARRDYSDTAYGWALEDTTSFAKVLVDPGAQPKAMFIWG